MRRSRHSDEQIFYALRQAEKGTVVAAACRQRRSTSEQIQRLAM